MPHSEHIDACANPSPRTFDLRPHPATPAPTSAAVTVRITPGGNGLLLSYRLAVPRLHIPSPAAPARADDLWRRTCCELFIGEAGGEAYREFNFSPSGAWAAYDFTAYRQSAACLPAGPAPSIRVRPGADALDVDVALAAAWLASAVSPRIGLSVVTETDDGTLACWALHHPSSRPDFHDAAARTITLDISA